MHEQQILTTIEALRVRIDERFDIVDTKFDKFDERARTIETDITRIKTAGSGVAAVLGFIGWGYVKPWLTSLMR